MSGAGAVVSWQILYRYGKITGKYGEIHGNPV
jgi:hypothetical protein